MTPSFSGLRRTEIVDQVSDGQFDLIIIGGGITGAGIALDAASRGLKTLLLEMQDFAQGTSSRSTKLVHGGLRYLKQLDVKVVAEVGKERAIVYENGPHVTTPEWMLLPIFKDGTFGKFSTSIGLRVYDYLAGVKAKERRKMLNREQTLAKAPLLKTDNLLGSGYYVEYRTDDARLTIEVLKEAVQQGATALNYAKAEGFVYKNSNVCGVRFTDQLSGNEVTVSARKVVNATGPWVDNLREKDNSKQGKYLFLTKGVHLVFDQRRFPLKQAVYFDTPDKRMIFAIPRDGKTYVGTTDTKYEGDLANPRMTEEDKRYVLNAIDFMFPDLKINASDIESSWVGLRPLIHEEGKKPSEISRRDEIWVSPSGLITIAGGKLTGYRKMAEIVVDRLSEMFKKDGVKTLLGCRTKNIPISGGKVGGSDGFHEFVMEQAEAGVRHGYSKEQAEKMVRRYGSNIDRIYELTDEYRSGAEKTNLPLDIYIQIIYSIHEEMTMTPADFLIRRTGALLFDRAWVERYKQPIVTCISQLYGLDQSQAKRAEQEIDELLLAVVEAV